MKRFLSLVLVLALAATAFAGCGESKPGTESGAESTPAPEVKIEKAKQSVRRLLDFNYNGINDILIEEVVDKIIVHKEWFEWKLVFLNEPINLEVKGKKQDYIIVEHEK